MTSSTELKTKYEAALDKVNKRKAIIKKNCDKIDISYDVLMNRYYEFIENYKETYLRFKDAKAIVSELTDTTGIGYGDPTDNVIESLPKLFDLEKVANNWKVKLDTQLNRENAPKIKVLVDFLDKWGERAKAFYRSEAERYVKLLNDFHDNASEFLLCNGVDEMTYSEQRAFVATFNEWALDAMGTRNRYSFGATDAESYANPKVEGLTRELASVSFDYIKDYNFSQVFGYSLDEGEYVLKGINEEKLNKVIEDEKVRKYEDLCARISAVVGEITDCDNLYIGAKDGELNGIVTGTLGKARVETIGAGGYNVGTIVNVRCGQVFHYRVLVHKLK